MTTLPWRTRIALAKQRGRFNQNDWRDGTAWCSCAVAEQGERAGERGYNGKPLDSKLYELGIVFSLAIKADDFDSASHALEQIERRTAEMGGAS